MCSGHTNAGFGAGWLLDGVIVTSQRLNKSFTFPCGRWLADNEDDKQVVRELVATNGSLPALQSVVYAIQVKTGDRLGGALCATWRRRRDGVVGVQRAPTPTSSWRSTAATATAASAS